MNKEDEYQEDAAEKAEELRQLVKQGKAVDINNLPHQQHNWIDRGLFMSCEGAAHPYHKAYKRR